MFKIKNLLWIIGFALFAQNKSFACSLDLNKLGDYPPHTEVRRDLNSDGVPDYFYLAGEEYEFDTCIYLGKKHGTKTTLKLIHEDNANYDTILDLNDDGRPKLLVPKMPINGDQYPDVCNIDLIPKSLQIKVSKRYKKWAKGFEDYNFTYSLPDFYPVFDLFLPYETKVYSFQGEKLIDVTSQMKDYLDLKKEVLVALLNLKDLSPECRSVCEKTKSAVESMSIQ